MRTLKVLNLDRIVGEREQWGSWPPAQECLLAILRRI